MDTYTRLTYARIMDAAKKFLEAQEYEIHKIVVLDDDTFIIACNKDAIEIIKVVFSKDAFSPDEYFDRDTFEVLLDDCVDILETFEGIEIAPAIMNFKVVRPERALIRFTHFKF